MSLKKDLARRSVSEWTIRLFLATGLAVFCLFSITFSFAQMVVAEDPVLAEKLSPYDGRILGAYATSLVDENAGAAQRARADAVAKIALQRDPTAVSAAATLGMNADTRGDSVGAQRYFSYAQTLSRRDLRTQLFMIESAVQRGDIQAAVHQYDGTLRVFPRLGDMLYPVLALAAGNPPIRRELIKTLAGRPIWATDFINFVAAKSPDPQSTVVLFLDLYHAGITVPAGASATIVNALINAGRTDAAWTYYAVIHPGSDRRRSRDPQFSSRTMTPSQLDWIANNDGSSVTGSIQGGIFDFAAPAGVGGPVVQQFQLLPPGHYRLTGHSIGIAQTGSTGPYWVLTCAGGRELGRVEVPNSNVSKGSFSGPLTVPVECPIQNLVLMARASDAAEGVSGQFDRLQLVPAN